MTFVVAKTSVAENPKRIPFQIRNEEKKTLKQHFDCCHLFLIKLNEAINAQTIQLIESTVEQNPILRSTLYSVCMNVRLISPIRPL